MIKVSVIIPAYNIENYIERCLISIKNQTLQHIEIIVINDGSTDKTLEAIKNVAEGDDRFRIINKDNEGIIEARKSGLNIAKGEYIFFVDGDDWIKGNALELLYNKANNEDADIVISNAIKTDGNNSEVLNLYNIEREIEIKDDPIKHFLLDNILPSMLAQLIKKDFITGNSIVFPERLSYGEDVATSLSWLLYRPKISFINEGLYYYFQREDSISKIPGIKIKDIVVSFQFIKKQLEEKDLFNAYKYEFEKLCYRHIFIGKILRINKLYNFRKDIFKAYLSFNINIKSNKYIVYELKYNNWKYRLRVYLYHINYNLGILFDLVLGYVSI